jgi:CDP-diacylglycerol--serine O-phosphatidyltransferase
MAKKRKIGIRRGIHIIPNLLTTGNLFCGFLAIIYTFKGGPFYFYAAVAILIAVVFDQLDGKIARLAGASSRFGIEYDSLADLVSFGVAPALLIYYWALGGFGRLGWLAAFLFVACGALRLARFNVQTSTADPKYYTGLPIPAAATFIALTVLLYHRLGEKLTTEHIAILIMIYGLSFLMVSNIRYPSFKELGLIRRKPFSVLVFVVSSIVVIVAEPEIMLFLFCSAYVSLGPLNLLYRWRRMKALKAAMPEEKPDTVQG